METLLPALEHLLAEMNDAKAQLLNRWEQSALRVATAIAERIIRRELSQQPQITLDLIADTLRLAAGMTDITLHISPTDYENLGNANHRLSEPLGQLAPSAIVADPDDHTGWMPSENEVRRNRSAN